MPNLKPNDAYLLKFVTLSDGKVMGRHINLPFYEMQERVKYQRSTSEHARLRRYKYKMIIIAEAAVIGGLRSWIAWG